MEFFLFWKFKTKRKKNILFLSFYFIFLMNDWWIVNQKLITEEIVNEA
jgi:hypothetical protein